MTVAAARPPEPVRARMDVRAYHQMGRTGGIAPDARVELIDGEIVDVPPIGPDHACSVNTLTHGLTAAAIGEYTVLSVQNPLTMGAENEF